MMEQVTLKALASVSHDELAAILSGTASICSTVTAWNAMPKKR
jgi:hypothetical protein